MHVTVVPESLVQALIISVKRYLGMSLRQCSTVFKASR